MRTLMLVSAMVAVLLGTAVAMTASDRDSARAIMALSQMEPPKRPEQFRNIDELNQYLAELRQYYTILGRPR